MFSGGVQHPEVTAVFSIAVSHRLLVKQEEKEEEELDSRGGEKELQPFGMSTKAHSQRLLKRSPSRNAWPVETIMAGITQMVQKHTSGAAVFGPPTPQCAFLQKRARQLSPGSPPQFANKVNAKYAQVYRLAVARGMSAEQKLNFRSSGGVEIQ